MTLSSVAIKMARNAVAQLTDMATSYRGPALDGYMYEAYIDEELETALMAASAAARLAGGRGMQLEIQASTTT